MQQFIRLATGRPLRIRLSFLVKTKGSLYTDLENAAVVVSLIGLFLATDFPYG